MRPWRCIGAVFAAGVLLILGLYAAAQIAVNETGPALADGDATAPVVIVLGASVKKDGTPSDILQDRLDVALAAYKAGRVEQILVSGSVIGDYNEVAAMERYVLDAGVAQEDVLVDRYGFDTYDTMLNAARKFNVTQAFVATQEYHLPRAIYIGRALGIEVHGLSADLHTYVKEDAFLLRERFANVKAFLQILTH